MANDSISNEQKDEFTFIADGRDVSVRNGEEEITLKNITMDDLQQMSKQDILNLLEDKATWNGLTFKEKIQASVATGKNLIKDTPGGIAKTTGKGIGFPTKFAKIMGRKFKEGLDEIAADA